MNILLVSNDEKSAQTVVKKLIFLRRDDNITIVNYENALDEYSFANIVLVQEDNDFIKTANLIKEIRENSSVGIIYLANSYNAENILLAADNGADDFILQSADNFELVLRIVNNLRYDSYKFSAQRYLKILENMKITDSVTTLYSYENLKLVIESIIDNESIKSGMFMAISPSKKDKINFSTEEFAKVLIKSVRKGDILSNGKGISFYILLPETDMNDAITVLNKIEENYGYELRAGITSITNKSFDIFEKNAIKSMSEAIATENSYVYFEDEKQDTLDEWIDVPKQKNYKIYRQMFNKKLEKVISPVFYRLQKTYEEKLFDTVIEQYVTNDQCVFSLKNKNASSVLRIVYPGFTKIIVSIVHEGLDSPENKEIQLQLSKVTQSELVVLIEDFIKEFRGKHAF